MLRAVSSRDDDVIDVDESLDELTELIVIAAWAQVPLPAIILPRTKPALIVLPEQIEAPRVHVATARPGSRAMQLSAFGVRPKRRDVRAS